MGQDPLIKFIVSIKIHPRKQNGCARKAAALRRGSSVTSCYAERVKLKMPPVCRTC
jgi:hypothetical protein